jgi:hypothetical protein
MNIKEFLKKIRAFLNLTYYTSTLDQFLSYFDKTHPKLSESQRLEKEKYDHIFKMRDEATASKTKKTLWNKF